MSFNEFMYLFFYIGEIWVQKVIFPKWIEYNEKWKSGYFNHLVVFHLKEMRGIDLNELFSENTISKVFVDCV